MHHAMRAWETMTRPERIVAMSLVAGSVIAIVNSTVWAVAVSSMTRQQARVRLAQLQLDHALAARDAAREPSAPLSSADPRGGANSVVAPMR